MAKRHFAVTGCFVAGWLRQPQRSETDTSRPRQQRIRPLRKRLRPPPRRETALPQLVTWQPDGIISDNEYPKQTTINGVDVFWRTDDTYLYLAARTRTIGWIAVGLAPDNRMMGANMIIGAIVDGKAVLEDHYGTGPTGHSADTGLGGTNDIAAFGGSQENGVTLWEAQIPLDSGDQYDKPLELRQTVAVIVATGLAVTFIDPLRAAGQITLD